MDKTLLVVDDDANIRRILSLSFRALGYRVLEAADGEEGERAALREEPDLVLLDVMMPKKDGYAVCRDLKVNPLFHQVPVVLLTAKNQREDVFSGFDCGADAYVTKPYDPRHLEALVAELLAEAAAGRRRVAWTGLPSGIRVEEEYRSRLEAGGVPSLFEMRMTDAAKESLEREIGSPRLRDLVHRLSWALHEALQRAAPGGVLGQKEDDSYLLILDPGSEDSTRRALLAAAQAVLERAVEEGSGDAAPRSVSFGWRKRE